ncbi:MAG: hypothetical protein R2788_07770 [Saprospiraceae bacterium]
MARQSTLPTILFSFNLLVNGTSTSAGWTTSINNQNYSGAYGAPAPISGLISEGAIKFCAFSTPLDSSCTTSQTSPLPVLFPMSIHALLLAIASNPICNNNGTASDPADDTYTFNLTVTGTNAGAGWDTNILGQAQSGTYGIAMQISVPYPISQGSQNIVVTDESDNTCTTSSRINPPCPLQQRYREQLLHFYERLPLARLDFKMSSLKILTIYPTSLLTVILPAFQQNVIAGNDYPIALTSGFSWNTYDDIGKFDRLH